MKNTPMTVKEILEKTEEITKNITKLNEHELNRLAGYTEGLLAAKDLRNVREESA